MKIMNLYDITSTWAASLNIFEGTCVFRSKIGQSQEEQQGFKATVPIYLNCPYLTAGLYAALEKKKNQILMDAKIKIIENCAKIEAARDVENNMQ